MSYLSTFDCFVLIFLYSFPCTCSDSRIRMLKDIDFFNFLPTFYFGSSICTERAISHISFKGYAFLLNKNQVPPHVFNSNVIFLHFLESYDVIN